MPDQENKPMPKPDEKMPSDATPHNPGISPKPGEPDGTTDAAPYDKKPETAQQPSKARSSD